MCVHWTLMHLHQDAKLLAQNQAEHLTQQSTASQTLTSDGQESERSSGRDRPESTHEHPQSNCDGQDLPAEMSSTPSPSAGKCTPCVTPEMMEKIGEVVETRLEALKRKMWKACLDLVSPPFREVDEADDRLSVLSHLFEALSPVLCASIVCIIILHTCHMCAVLATARRG
jgi:hypothetical protein